MSIISLTSIHLTKYSHKWALSLTTEQLKTSLIQSKNIRMICLINVNEMIEWSHKPPINLTTVQASSVGGATSIIFVVTNVLSQMFCQNKHMFVMKKHIFCHDKSRFVMINFCHEKIVCGDKTFVATNTFVATSFVTTSIFYFMTKDMFCYDKYNVCCHKSILVVTKVLSQHNYVCHGKCLSWQVLSWQNMTKIFCHDKRNFFTTKLLSQQKWYLWQLPPVTSMNKSHPIKQPDCALMHGTNFTDRENNSQQIQCYKTAHKMMSISERRLSYHRNNCAWSKSLTANVIQTTHS